MRHIPAERLPETGPVVGVDLRVVSPPGDRDIREPAVNELLAERGGIHVQEHAICGLPLAAVTGHGIAVVEMSVCFEGERHRSTGIEPDSKLPVGVDMLEGTELAIRHVPCAERGRELHAVTSRKCALRLAKES